MSPPKGYRLESLKVNRYRHVRPGTEVHFDEDWNLLLGKNGSGKTTLLDLIACVVSGNFTALDTEEYDLKFAIRMAWGLLECGVRNELSSQSPRAVAMDSVPSGTIHEPPDLRFSAHGRLIVDDPLDSFAIEIDNNGKVRLNGLEGPPTPIAFRRSLYGAMMSALPEWRSKTPPSVTYASTRFDEALIAFRTLVGKQQDPPLTEQLISLSHELGAIRSASSTMLMPTDFWIALFAAQRDDVEGPVISIPANALEFLSETTRLLGFKDASLRLPLRERNTSGRSTTSVYGPSVFQFTRENGAVVHHDHLSFGQKRLLALLHHVASNPHVVIADELVNGFHHEMIEAVLQKMEGRQRFLATQNPLLLDHVPFSSTRDARARLIQCTTEDDQMVWSNLSEDDGEVFYAAYEAGIQHVGEILRTKGLW